MNVCDLRGGKSDVPSEESVVGKTGCEVSRLSQVGCCNGSDPAEVQLVSGIGECQIDVGFGVIFLRVDELTEKHHQKYERDWQTHLADRETRIPLPQNTILIAERLEMHL